MSEFVIELLITLSKISVVLAVLLTGVAYSVYAERRVSAFIQNRYGPNRVGPQGLLQPLVDVIKLLLKEDIVPASANKFIHSLAPVISIIVSLSTFAVIPFGDTITIGDRVIKLQIADVNIGVLYFLAMTSLGVYGVTLSGWSSNNKYSLLGGLRSSAQMISYELSMGLAIIAIILMNGSLQLDVMVNNQAGWKWNIFLQPVGFIIFLVSAFAETNRTPFDLPEAEQELVGGYHTEYSSMKFALFFLAEYANVIISSAMITTIYLGGWQFPYLQDFGLPPMLVSIIQILTFVTKVVALVFFFIWVRWTIPRFRYDQLMNLGWKIMLPLGIANLVVTAIVLMLLK
ncbi:MAG TPA: NADH-quinone oxidoreductase subunit NuoH [Ignavibacteria bacterium]|nr:NADH-quinone oxidoreductase subunit NuoH [Bacteroidota bacterium]HRI85569.1 NADH-quinone oxidoreductase subunit NuoH [Ignavibacteria bacterium]HRK00597.1 NADH-quinone oxidoreductase subunit NuoH [Ignavibacteria bacterium]